ncbi:fatty acid desaturase [Inquilinus sp. Marseille-Q2685]|uniref:fatty acid desaturase n=1 Tax=Inquilinus sp. Marseille-Q2685 TaxID=2866581 RepID=UPI001CE3EFE0|nr:fatty acid desaturase [Inquilinus sp. Marseille-Q2685]
MAETTKRANFEGPTWAVAAAVYGGWAALLWFHAAIPAPLFVAAGAVLLAWHGSLQHETIHGHPTRSRRINTAVGWPPLSLWLPYASYRDLHLRHHRDAHLTSPVEDPESYYITGDRWSALSPAGRAVLRFNRTLLGRFLIGPALAWYGLWAEELPALRHDRRARIVWATHLAGAAAVLAVVTVGFGVSPILYVVTCYAGTSLSLLRSFAEHRAGPEGLRTAVVASGPFFSLLFLNNNLHVAHHARPGLAWYRLPRFAAANDSAAVAARGAGLYHGYGEIVRRFLLRPVDAPVHPDFDTERRVK